MSKKTNKRVKKPSKKHIREQYKRTKKFNDAMDKWKDRFAKGR